MRPPMRLECPEPATLPAAKPGLRSTGVLPPAPRRPTGNAANQDPRRDISPRQTSAGLHPGPQHRRLHRQILLPACSWESAPTTPWRGSFKSCNIQGKDCVEVTFARCECKGLSLCDNGNACPGKSRCGRCQTWLSPSARPGRMLSGLVQGLRSGSCHLRTTTR